MNTLLFRLAKAILFMNPVRFQLGKELTTHELREAFKAIFNRPLPPGSNTAAVARTLSERMPLRFEFEINRQRGFAWDG
jgi:hypothetical protein